MQLLKKNLRAARQAEDPKAETEALTAISQLGYEQGKLLNLKLKIKCREKAAKEKPKQQPISTTKTSSAQPDPKAEAWASKNEWFGKDSVQ